jgi:hypothetical protein
VARLPPQLCADCGRAAQVERHPDGAACAESGCGGSALGTTWSISARCSGCGRRGRSPTVVSRVVDACDALRRRGPLTAPPLRARLAGVGRALAVTGSSSSAPRPPSPLPCCSSCCCCCCQYSTSSGLASTAPAAADGGAAHGGAARGAARRGAHGRGRGRYLRVLSSVFCSIAVRVKSSPNDINVR